MRRMLTCGNQPTPILEPLERRALLAGNVSVFLDAQGNLQILGDAKANGLSVDQFGDITIQGTDAGGSPARINGVANDVVVFEVSGGGDIHIDLRGGNDSVRIGERSDDVNAPDDLEILTGAGNDHVLITGDTNVGDDLLTDSGAGADLVDVRNVDVADHVTIATSAGDDVVRLLAVRIVGATAVNTGDGADRIYTNFEALFGAAVNIDTGRHDDFLQITTSRFAGPVHVSMGRGDDRLCLEGSTFNSESTSFDGGPGGADTWAINSTTFAGDPLLGDITPGFEFEFDDCTFFEQYDCFCGVF